MSYSGEVFDLNSGINSKESIRRKLEIEEVLLEISNMFIAPASLGRDINVTLEKIGRLCGAGRSYIFLLRENDTAFDNTHEWCAEGVEPQKNNLQNVPCEECPWWMEKLSNDEVLHIPDVSALPPEAEVEKEVLGKQGIKSLIVLPLYVSGKLAGFMGLDNVVNTGSWGTDDASILRIAVNIMGMGIQRRKAEEAIRAEKEIYRSTFENAANLILLVDKKGVIVDCNSRAEKLLGYRRFELIGKAIKSILFSDHIKKFEEYSEEVENRGFSFNKEYRMVRKDGNPVDVNVNSSGLKDENGFNIQTIYIVEDITERKKAEKLIQESEARYRFLFQNNRAVIMLLDPNTGNILDANTAACSYYGYTREKMLNLNIADINILPKEQIIEGLKQEKFRDTNHFFFTHRLSNGVLRDVERYSYPILMDGKKLLFSIVSDITDNRKMQSELVRAKMEAEFASKAKSEFLASMSHELRTPLNSIIGFSDMLFTQNFGPLNEKQLRYVSNISVSGNHLLKLINDILDLSKVEAGKMELEVEEFSVSDSISEVKTLLTPLASKKDIQILSMVDKGLTTIRADRTKFKQILYNLVDNAIKFTHEEGYVVVNASVEGDQAKIMVKDTGVGISEAEAKKIFQPFIQLENSEYGKQKGTGLGLSLVKKFVEMHTGKIWVESKFGEGSKFIFTIPLNLPLSPTN
ncbi:sensory transduction histidine kinase [Methanosarcina siciliae T4/M]|uniref:histidine kinase n=1 Tax=Methanosarcina siciliae T4/M TaxID=1434120 RepID=A0A0E3P4Y6_9EURY|nr:PAS domain S-box protein [Methanosarcina siciliae]AKB28857.1 sensory transduction histidine kinase [Methanosarcina siciliae T4/M]